MRAVSIICILGFLIGRSFAQEQIKQNVYSLGGMIYYSSSTEKDDNSKYDQSLYVIMPSISYFIVDQCELSVSIGYVRSISKYSSSLYTYYSQQDSKSTSLDLELGIRYYFPAGKIAPFIGASGGTSWTSRQSESFSTPQTNFSLTGGIEIFISESAAIEPAIQYKSYRYNDQISSSGIQVGIGAKYFIL